MSFLLDPKIFNYLILALFAFATLRWALASAWWEALYWFGAFLLNVAVTWGFPR